MAQSYDFVIIGGGTAGLVVASRLSEDASKSVLVLEAGLDLTEDARVSTPILAGTLHGSETDWQFRSEPQPGLNGRLVSLTQGKVLGGSSAVNVQVFVPPSKGEIDSWEALGNPGWNWDSLRAYLAKAYSSPDVDEETLEALAIDGWPGLNAAQGPIQTSFGNKTHPIRKAWADAFRSSGQYIARDPFWHSSVGAFSCLASVDARGRRSYSASAYYKPFKHRENLHVLTNAHVDKILLHKVAGGGVKAVGVQYKLEDAPVTVYAKNEVILAAGPVQSPKILQLSGIGPGHLLQKYSIEVLADLPGVGQNLQDHPGIHISFHADKHLETYDALARQEPEAVFQAKQEYETNQTGLMSSAGVHSFAYLPLVREDQEALRALLTEHSPSHSQQSNAIQAYYDIAQKSILDPKQPSAAYLVTLSQMMFTKNPVDGLQRRFSPGKYITFIMMLSQPLSRGNVQIASSNPQDAPTIDPKYLSHPLDIEIMARHLRRIHPLAQSPQFASILEQPLKFMDPAADVQGDLARAKQYIRENAFSFWHLAGTCAMLPRDKHGVVDARLRVYGVESLRVVDSSVVPLMSTANLQTTVYAVAEKAADLIKDDWCM